MIFLRQLYMPKIDNICKFLLAQRTQKTYYPYCKVTSVVSDFRDRMNPRLPGSFGHRISQARILEHIAVPSSKGSSQPRDRTCVSYISCVSMWIPYHQHFLGNLQFSSVQFSRSVVSDSLRPHELQHTRPPSPSPTPGVYSNSCPSTW